MARSIPSREAPFGQKMIEIRVRFWTDGIAEGERMIKPKRAWTRGIARISRNEAHGIVPAPGRPFNSLMELPGVIEKVLIDNGIELHMCHKMDRYVRRD